MKPFILLLPIIFGISVTFCQTPYQLIQNETVILSRAYQTLISLLTSLEKEFSAFSTYPNVLMDHVKFYPVTDEKKVPSHQFFFALLYLTNYMYTEKKYSEDPKAALKEYKAMTTLKMETLQLFFHQENHTSLKYMSDYMYLIAKIQMSSPSLKPKSRIQDNSCDLAPNAYPQFLAWEKEVKAFPEEWFWSYNITQKDVILALYYLSTWSNGIISDNNCLEFLKVIQNIPSVSLAKGFTPFYRQLMPRDFKDPPLAYLSFNMSNSFQESISIFSGILNQLKSIKV